jgi:hypothetical protein
MGQFTETKWMTHMSRLPSGGQMKRGNNEVHLLPRKNQTPNPYNKI